MPLIDILFFFVLPNLVVFGIIGFIIKKIIRYIEDIRWGNDIKRAFAWKSLLTMIFSILGVVLCVIPVVYYYNHPNTLYLPSIVIPILIVVGAIGLIIKKGITIISLIKWVIGEREWVYILIGIFFVLNVISVVHCFNHPNEPYLAGFIGDVCIKVAGSHIGKIIKTLWNWVFLG